MIAEREQFKNERIYHIAFLELNFTIIKHAKNCLSSSPTYVRGSRPFRVGLTESFKGEEPQDKGRSWYMKKYAKSYEAFAKLMIISYKPLPNLIMISYKLTTDVYSYF